jgi:hypothetical protein
MTARWGAVFVCQGGGLERKAALLAASIRRRNGPAPQLVAAIPGPSAMWPRPTDATLAYLDRLNVRIEETENPIGEHYPIGNKLGCLAVAPKVDRCFFLDSDLLALKPVLAADLPIAAVAAKPEDRPGPWSDKRAWRRLYRWAGIPKWNRDDEIVTTISGHRIPPYFNAGVVGFDPASDFAERWLSWAKRIDPTTEIIHRHPWLDQLALPIAASEMGVKPERLDASWNWPAHHWLLEEPVRFAHYHEPAVIEEDPMLWTAFRELVDGDDELASLLKQDDVWQRVIERSSPLSRSQLVLLGARPNDGVETALEAFRAQGFATVRADLPFVRRTHKDKDATGIGPWLRRFWLEADPYRQDLVIWDDTTLITDIDRIFGSVDGYTVAAWSSDQHRDDPPAGIGLWAGTCGLLV